MFGGVRNYCAYRMVAAVTACIVLGGVLHTGESYLGKPLIVLGAGFSSNHTCASHLGKTSKYQPSKLEDGVASAALKSNMARGF